MLAKYLSCDESVCSSCIGREKLMSIVRALSLDAVVVWSGRHRARHPSSDAAQAVVAWSGGRQSNRGASWWVGPGWWLEGGAATCSSMSSSTAQRRAPANTPDMRHLSPMMDGAPTLFKCLHINDVYYPIL